MDDTKKKLNMDIGFACSAFKRLTIALEKTPYLIAKKKVGTSPPGSNKAGARWVMSQH